MDSFAALVSKEAWGVLIGAFLGALFGAIASVMVIMWQQRSEAKAKRKALFELLAVEHAKTEDSIGTLADTRLYLPIALSAPAQLLSEGLLQYYNEKHRALLTALMQLQRSVAVFNRLAEASNMAAVYPPLGANTHNALKGFIKQATKDFVDAWGIVETAMRGIDPTIFPRALGKETD